MIQFDARLFITWLRLIEEMEDCLLGDRPFGVQLSESDLPDQLLTNDGRKWLWAHLGPLQEELKRLNLDASLIDIQYIWNHAHIWSAKEIATNLKGLRWKVEQELRGRFFLYLEPKEAKIFAAEFPFGESIAVGFPSASFDAREAAQSYATGRHTAAVFYCMRVLEHGLRALAKHVDESFDMQNWYNIINEIEKKIRTRANEPKSVTKDDEMQFLSEAAKEFSYFKDGWRNYVSHGRLRYDQSQALSAFNHTKAFMQQLGKKLHEA